MNSKNPTFPGFCNKSPVWFSAIIHPPWHASKCFVEPVNATTCKYQLWNANECNQLTCHWMRFLFTQGPLEFPFWLTCSELFFTPWHHFGYTRLSSQDPPPIHHGRDLCWRLAFWQIMCHFSALNQAPSVERTWLIMPALGGDGAWTTVLDPTTHLPSALW